MTTAAAAGRATPAQVEAAQVALGCERAQYGLEHGQPWRCSTHRGYIVNEWTQLGCPVAVAAADAVAAAGGAASPATGGKLEGGAEATVPTDGSLHEPGPTTPDTAPDTAPDADADAPAYTLGEAYEDGYDQGHADAHEDGAATDRLCRMRMRAEAAEAEVEVQRDRARRRARRQARRLKHLRRYRKAVERLFDQGSVNGHVECDRYDEAIAALDQQAAKRDRAATR